MRGRRYERTGVVAALWEKTVIAPYQYGGAMDSEFFEGWFESALPAGSVIVMDNASFHRKAACTRLRRGRGTRCFSCRLTPPSSTR